MYNFKLRTSVAFIIFKRPDTTEKVFEAIRQAKPPKLFVIADGPRKDIFGEAEKCTATRAIIDRVDWDCEILNNYSDINLGCAKRVSSGLNWVFEHVEEAIILEDDCLPHPTFFQFCEELLERYKSDERIGSISGQNVQFGKNKTEYSYYFSRYNHIWGWATWRRAWKYFDFDMKYWNEIETDNILRNILLDSRTRYKWNNRFRNTYHNKIDSWGYRWQLSCWLNHFLGIISNVSLISNIGNGIEATHTKDNHKYTNLSIQHVDFPLKHPPFMIQNIDADNLTEVTLFNQKTLLQKLKAEIKYRLRIDDAI